MEYRYDPGIQVGDYVTIKLYSGYEKSIRTGWFKHKRVSVLRGAKVVEIDRWGLSLMVKYEGERFYFAPHCGKLYRRYHKPATEEKVINIAKAFGRRSA